MACSSKRKGAEAGTSVRQELRPVWCPFFEQSSLHFLFFITTPWRRFHTFEIQSNVPSSSIHPFGCALTITPDGNLAFLGSVFLLNIITGRSFVPSARQERTTVKCVFSWPVVRTKTVFKRQLSTVRLPGRSNVMGVSSMFPMSDNSNSCFFRFFIMKDWKLLTFSSRSLGSFCEIFVRCHKLKPCRFINLLHQTEDALNVVESGVLNFSSLAICIARIRIADLDTMYPFSLHSNTRLFKSFSSSENKAIPLLRAFFDFGIPSNSTFCNLQSLTDFSLTLNSRPAALLLLTQHKPQLLI